MWVPLFLLILFAACAASTHPECRWLCDDPVCPAVCAPVCAPLACAVTCNASYQCNPPVCEIRCEPDQSESDACPACTPLCEMPVCQPADPHVLGHCETHCQPLECAWRCTKPVDCPRPTCQLSCERPACEEAAWPGTPETRACVTHANAYYDVHCFPTRKCRVALATNASLVCPS